MNTNLYPRLFKIALIGLLSLAIWACTTTPGASPTAPGTGTPPLGQVDGVAVDTVPAAIATLPVLRVWLDCSTSMQQAVFEKNIDGMITSLKIHSRLMSGVEVLCFAKGNASIWDERPDRFIWQSAPSNPPPFAPNFDKAQPKERMFKDSRDKLVAMQKAAYDTAIATELDAYDKSVTLELKFLRERLLRVPPFAAPCTHFSELAHRLQQESLALNMVISDGYPDCEDKALGTMQPVSIKGRIVFVQVPAKGNSSSSGNVIREREVFIKSVMPNASSVPIYMPDDAVSALFR